MLKATQYQVYEIFVQNSIYFTTAALSTFGEKQGKSSNNLLKELSNLSQLKIIPFLIIIFVHKGPLHTKCPLPPFAKILKYL